MPQKPLQGYLRLFHIQLVRRTHLLKFLHSQTTDIRNSLPLTKNTLDASAEFNLHALEANTIRAALALSGGNRTHAAELLGVSRRTLQRKLKDLGL